MNSSTTGTRGNDDLLTHDSRPSIRPGGLVEVEMRSPIEMLIDKACGFDRENYKPDFITLRCPQCKREKRAPRDASDLPGTAIVVAHCNECSGEDNGLYPEYFRENGTQILEGP
jgi:hypothetical protein